jgi:hypothetical protein
MQGLAGLLESTGIPKTVERLAYNEPLTNLQQANVPALRPETANALMTLLPVPSGANRAAMAAGRAGERMAERVVPQVMERGGVPAGLLDALSAQTVSPLTVYHGSPAKFSRFDPTKIGSGEGAQAFGYGHYVAESPAVARGYQEKLSSTGGAKRLLSQFGQLDDAITEAQKRVTHYENLIKQRAENVPLDRANSFLEISKKNLQDLQDMKAGVPENKGAFYEIDLPDEQIAKMIDFDKPLIQQSKEIQALAKQYGLTDADHLGGDLIAAMDAKRPAGAEAMRQAGVPGIRYFDQDSRGAGAGTSNFVVFPGNEDLLTILRRNGGLLD